MGESGERGGLGTLVPRHHEHLARRGNRRTSTPATGSATTYSYDQTNRLTSVGGTATYRYDGDDLRTGKTVGTTATAYSWGAGSIANLLSDGTTDYVYGPGGLLIEQISGGTTLWFFHDSYTEYGVASNVGTASTAPRSRWRPRRGVAARYLRPTASRSTRSGA
ncbi:MAG: hypothetical protein ABIQ18_26675 [Umezawaea sp.]